ncbi:MAG: pilus assembly protein TadG-related protein [Pseudomonadota bacterium]
MFNRFRHSSDGNIAIMFGLFLIPLLVGAGLGLDMLRAHDVRSSIREAADAGVLAAARATMLDPDLTVDQAKEVARRYFDANGPSSGLIEIDVFNFTPAPDGESFQLDVGGRIKTALLSVIGRNEIPVNVISSAKISPVGPIEAVMVLDNTGSMLGTKLADLKSASHNLTNMLLGPPGSENKMALVPFAQYVNVGSGNLGESWLDDGLLPPSSLGIPWEGCVGSRAATLNTTDEDFGSDPVPALSTVPCPAPVLPLTDDQSDVDDAIDAMAADGWTYIATGLAWGHRVVSPGAPFTEGLTDAALDDVNGVKAIILMTDGANTRASSFPFHESVSEADANTATRQTCDSVKAAGIRLYTIAFDVTDTTIKSLLTDCASDDGGYFDASDGAALDNAFSTIGIDLIDLALTE